MINQQQGCNSLIIRTNTPWFLRLKQECMISRKGSHMTILTDILSAIWFTLTHRMMRHFCITNSILTDKKYIFLFGYTSTCVRDHFTVKDTLLLVISLNCTYTLASIYTHTDNGRSWKLLEIWYIQAYIALQWETSVSSSTIKRVESTLGWSPDTAQWMNRVKCLPIRQHDYTIHHRLPTTGLI